MKRGVHGVECRSPGGHGFLLLLTPARVMELHVRNVMDGVRPPASVAASNDTLPKQRLTRLFVLSRCNLQVLYLVRRIGGKYVME